MIEHLGHKCGARSVDQTGLKKYTNKKTREKVVEKGEVAAVVVIPANGETSVIHTYMPCMHKLTNPLHTNK